MDPKKTLFPCFPRVDHAQSDSSNEISTSSSSDDAGRGAGSRGLDLDLDLERDRDSDRGRDRDRDNDRKRERDRDRDRGDSCGGVRECDRDCAGRVWAGIGERSNGMLEGLLPPCPWLASSLGIGDGTEVPDSSKEMSTSSSWLDSTRARAGGEVNIPGGGGFAAAPSPESSNEISTSSSSSSCDGAWRCRDCAGTGEGAGALWESPDSSNEITTSSSLEAAACVCCG